MIQPYSRYISRISGISDVYVDVGNIKHRYIAGISKKDIYIWAYIKSLIFFLPLLEFLTLSNQRAETCV